MSHIQTVLFLLSGLRLVGAGQAVVGTLVNSRRANAKSGGPIVTIRAPLPVPFTISKSNAVSGTMAQTQSMQPIGGVR